MDFLRLVPQILAAAFIVGFFVLAALVIFGTILACVRSRQPTRTGPARRAAVPRSRRSPARPAPEQAAEHPSAVRA